MDSLSFSKLQFEKANAIYKYRQRQRIAKFFRYLEIGVVVFLISRLSISIQVPGAVKNPSEYFRGVSGFLASPRFVFFVGNAIIITLFVKSGQFGSNHGASTSPSLNLYDEFIQNSASNQRNRQEETKVFEKPTLKTDFSGSRISKKEFYGEQNVKAEIGEKQKLNTEFHEKRGRKTECYEKQSLRAELHEKKSMKAAESVQVKQSQSQGENFSHGKSEKPALVLGRSETGKSMKTTQCCPGGKSAKCMYPEDDLSNEDFRLTVEAFIARQQRSLREEDYTF